MERNLSSDRGDSGIDNSSIASGFSGNSSLHSNTIAKTNDKNISSADNSKNINSKNDQSESTSTAIDLSFHQEDDDSLDIFKNQLDPTKNSTQRSSSDSGDGKSTYEIINYSNDDGNDEGSSSSSSRTFPKLDLNNGSQPYKIIENDCDQERDTFSPLSNDSDRQKVFPGCIAAGDNGTDDANINDCTPTSADSNTSSSYAHEYNLPLSPLTAATISGVAGLVVELDNKIIDKNTKTSKSNCLTSSSKEEKQRQNEEILQIMETSSVSSETGSWESVFPHRSTVNGNLSTNATTTDAKDYCHKFLENERKISDSTVIDYKSINRNPSTSTACFIDASTLLDESEVNEFVPIENIVGPKLPDIPCCGPKPVIDKNSVEANSSKPETSNTSSQEKTWGQKMHLDKLESFHRSFEKCKINKNEQQISQNYDSSSSCSSISPTRKYSGQTAPANQKITTETNNLSDEEKLLKRQVITRTVVKDQYNKESPTDPQISMKIFTSSSTDLTSSPENDANHKVRKDHERKQGNFVFQNNIQQFSTHLIEPQIPSTEPLNLNNPTQILASLAWSDSDQAKHSNTSFNTGEFIDETAQNNSQTKTNVILPDTPNNSIVQIEEPSSIDKNLKKKSSSFEYYELGNSKEVVIPKKPINRFDDLAPIVSGGASIKDFTPKQCESPPVTRKTDACPIVSGGFISLDFQRDDEIELAKKQESKLKPKHTWIVDMSDCNKNQRRQSSSSSSSSNENRDSIDRNSYGTRSTNSLGFYVSLNDMEPPKSLDGSIASDGSQRKISRSYHDNSFKQSTGFYVDMSENENSRNSTPSQKSSHTPPTTQNSKKNIFSMFIDFGENKSSSSRKDPISLASRLSSSLLQQPKRQNSDDSMKNSLSSQETLISNSHHGNTIFRHSEKLDSAGETMVGSSDESHKPSLQSIGNPSESPRVQRRNIVLTKREDDTKRHSWNISDQKDKNIVHKRSSSLTNTSAVDDDKNIMSILDKIPLISKTSSMSIDSSLSPLDDISKSEFSTYSNNSVNSNSGGFGIGIDGADKQKRRRRDVKINETFDKSSQGSITDGMLSKGISPSTDTDDITFQQDDQEILVESDTTTSLHKDRPVVMETIIETKETASPKKMQQQNANSQPAAISNINKIHTMESLHATVEKQKMLLETVNENAETTNANNFVRLSDLDKPISSHKFELHSPDTLMSKSVGNQRHLSRLFTTQQQRPHSWGMTRSTGNSIANITNSVDNIRSLSRLFPHLSKEFSNSLPNDVYSPEQQQQQQQSTSSKYIQQYYRSPIELEYMNSEDVSNESSLASSISRMDESSISCRQPRRLGEDLLKMFLQEIGTDVVVEVNGRRIKAHKCILRSRCQYFAAMLAGGWVQSAGNVISLQGYSYSSVHFALCHIYSGACHPPDGISLMELAALADLLGLEGLKEVTAHALKLNYCHNFHKPCSGCIDGILQVLPVALNHALDDLYRKCLKWTCKYYLKIWPTRSFALLPSEIFSRCRQLVVAHLTSETVLESILDCDNLLAQLAHCRWAAVVENLVRDILDSAYGYISDHFASLIASDSFLSLGHDKSENITRLENILLRTASTLNPDQACRSYQRVTRLNTVLAAKIIKMPGNADNNSNGGIVEDHEEEMEWNEEFTRLVSSILSAVEQCLTRQCSRAMRVSSWQRMDLELRKKIQKLACLTEPLDIRSRNLNNQKSGASVTKQISFSSNSRNQDLYQVKLAIQAHSKRALAQDTQLYRPQATNYHQDRNTQTIEKGTQANHEINEGKLMKSNSKSYVPNFAKTKINNIEKGGVPTASKYGHRRTYSEDTSVSTSKKLSDTLSGSTKSQQLEQQKAITKSQQVQSKPIAQRLVDIKPRYLEPRKPRSAPLGPLKSQTLSNITNKGKHISSSDSSRTSSPATGRRIIKHTGIGGTKSINMSLDSLASPSKRSNINQLQSRLHTENEISIDSLANSMKSSIKTDKTISQESLVTNSSGGIGVGINKKLISRSIPGLNNNIQNNNKFDVKTNNLTKPNLMINKKNGFSQFRPEQTLQIKSQKLHQQNISTGSSPSSMATTATNKSSRLSSVSSAAVASPRDALKNRSMSSTPNSVKKHSFLSAKSREILAKKAEKLQQQQEQHSKPDTADDKPSIQIQIQGKLFSSKPKNITNIPTRTQAPPTSLALKKKALPAQQQNLSQPTKSSLLKANTKNLNKFEKARYEKLTISKNERKKNDNNEYDSEKEYRIESKLERSSTFCKESSDLPVTELQIIE